VVGNGALTLAEARDKARLWLDMMARGIDPAVDAERQRAEAQRQQAATFASLWSLFEANHTSKLAKAEEARRAGAAFCKLWGARPATDVQAAEIAGYIRRIRGTPAEARNRLGHLSRFFSWAIGSGEFGVTTNPCSVLRPKDLIGAKIARDRVLSDAELRAVWAACGGDWTAAALASARRRDRPRDDSRALAFPYGPIVRLLILTGQRLREVAEMRWSEVDLDAAMWTISAQRMKGGRTHEVPLAPVALSLLRSLPRFAGDCVFSTTDGEKPVSAFADAKKRLDHASGVRDWVLHDLRRTFRTKLSALPIEDRVREQMIAHAAPGLHRVYDLHRYSDEKRMGFQLWENRLMTIVEPTPASVVSLEGARRRRAR
jgi:integrase